MTKPSNFTLKDITPKNSGYYTLWGLIFFFSGLSIMCFTFVKYISMISWNIIKNIEKNKSKSQNKKNNATKSEELYIKIGKNV